jgi:hypothetical protein
MAGDLSCSAGACVHNQGGLCTANQIHVGGIHAMTSAQTQCGTFAEKGFTNAVSHIGNMNIMGEIKQVFTNGTIQMSPYIKCDAVKCVYNGSGVCTASNVQISGINADNSEETKCSTFIE